MAHECSIRWFREGQSSWSGLLPLRELVLTHDHPPTCPFFALLRPVSRFLGFLAFLEFPADEKSKQRTSLVSTGVSSAAAPSVASSAAASPATASCTQR